MEESRKQDIKRGVNQIGWRYGVLSLVILAMSYFAMPALSNLAPEFVNEHRVLLVYLLTILVIYVIGFPLISLLCKNVEKVEIPKQKYGVKNCILGIFYIVAICMIGSIIGVVVDTLLTLPFGIETEDSSGITEILMNSSIFMRIFVPGILAPIFEELIFRKILIDRLAKYGKVLAIMASGIMFGLFHGNFTQFFYAAGIGFFFGYVYVKTGNIKYTIGYHMMVNLTSSIISVPMVQKYMEVLNTVYMDLMGPSSAQALQTILPILLLVIAWIGFLFCLGLTGIILFIVYRKKFRIEEENAYRKAGALKALLTSPGMWLFYIANLVEFATTYLPDIIASFR